MANRGEIWWGAAPYDKGRPLSVLSRDAANAAVRRVVPVVALPPGGSHDNRGALPTARACLDTPAG